MQLGILVTLGAGGITILIAFLLAVRKAGLLGRPNRTNPGGRTKRKRRIDANGNPGPSDARLWVRRGLRAGGILIVVLAAAEGVLVVRAASQLYTGVRELRNANAALGADPEKWTAANILTSDTLQKEAQSQLEDASRQLHGDPLLKLLAGVPGLDTQVTTTLDLAEASVSGAHAVGDVIQVARAVDDSRNSNAPTGQRLLTLIAAAQQPWGDAHAVLAPSLAKLRANSAKPLAAPLAKQNSLAIALLQPLDDIAGPGSQAASYAPDALGADKPRTYLVLMANPSELRPAGGFSGAIGTVTIANGTPTNIDIKNQEAFNPLVKKKVDVPYPMTRYLSFYKNSLELGDAGWDPNFPSTAQVSEQLYTSATGKPVDGTISIDPWAIQELLKVTGPVDVPAYGTFTSDDFFAKTNFIVNASKGPGSGKGALGPISQAVLQKVLTQPASAFPRLIAAFQSQAQTRHIQAALHDPVLSQAAAQVHFDGALVSTPGDYLMVSDGNVGANKADFYIQKSMQVLSEVPASGVVRHEVSVSYNLPAPKDDVDRALNPADGSYRDYVRFYLPQTANVVSFKYSVDSGPGGGGLDNVGVAHDHQVVGAFFKLARGHTAVLKLSYEVPVASGGSYNLLVQKQAGQLTMPTTVEISDPGGVTTQQASLDRDMNVGVTW